MFRKIFDKKPLTGAPAVRRLKTYSSDSGYVYQYAYEGQRPHAKGTEFVFTISPDRKHWRDVSVIVGEEAVRRWEETHRRKLSWTEWYAVAKMALFAAMDEWASPAAIGDVEAGVEEAAEKLGFVE